MSRAVAILALTAILGSPVLGCVADSLMAAHACCQKPKQSEPDCCQLKSEAATTVPSNPAPWAKSQIGLAVVGVAATPAQSHLLEDSTAVSHVSHGAVFLKNRSLRL